ncbi:MULTISPECIES: hypothetical protein [Paenibacillus]|nr:hypothetical protein [Paenibacillus odorifer]
MNPRADVFWYDAKGKYRPLLDGDVEEIYVPEETAKTEAHIGG